MYPNLRAEMARHQITAEMIAKALGFSPSTISAKLNSPDRIKLSECKKIITIFFPDKTLDTLFGTEETCSDKAS